jgi:hypothetical protein
MVARPEVMVIEGTSKRMDIVVHLPNSVLWIDVSVVNPACKSYAGKLLAPHQLRALTKEGRWKRFADAKGITFIPAIFEVCGGVGSGVNNLLSTIARSALAHYPYPLQGSRPQWLARYRRQLMLHLQVALAHANHCMIEEAQMRSSNVGWGGTQSTRLYSGLNRRRVFKPSHMY